MSAYSSLASLPAHVLHARLLKTRDLAPEKDTETDTLLGIPASQRRKPSTWSGWGAEDQFGGMFANPYGPLRDGFTHADRMVARNADILVTQSAHEIKLSELDTCDVAKVFSSHDRVVVIADIVKVPAALSKILLANKPPPNTEIVVRGRHMTVATLRWFKVNGWAPREWVIDTDVRRGVDPLAGSTMHVVFPSLKYLRVGRSARVWDASGLFFLVQKKYAPNLKAILDNRGVPYQIVHGADIV